MSNFSAYFEFLIDLNNQNVKSFIHNESFGIYGFCQAQDPIFVKDAIETELGDYSTQEPSHVTGQNTVDVVLSVFNSIPEICVFQTPPNSAADVGLRWDLIMTYQDLFFPIQVKSSLQQILKLTECDEIEDRNEAIREMSFILEENREYLNSYVDEKSSKISEREYKIEDIIRRLSFPSRDNHTGISARNDEDCQFYQNKERIGELRLKKKILEQEIESECWEKTHPLYIWVDTTDSTLKKTMEVMRQTLMQFIHPMDCRLTKIRQLEESEYIPQKLYQEKIEQKLQELSEKEKRQYFSIFLDDNNIGISERINSEKLILIASLLKYQIYLRERSIESKKETQKPISISQKKALEEATKILSICQEITDSRAYQEYFLIEAEQQQRVLNKLSGIIVSDKNDDSEISKNVQSIQISVKELLSYPSKIIENFIQQKEMLSNILEGELADIEDPEYLYIDM